MQKNIDEMTEHLERYTWDLKATEAEAKNTLDPNDRSYLEQFAEDLKQKINDYKDNHLKTLTNMEVQRIDVLELLSLEERIQIYESIMQEEINSV
ncbi:unnamed protein product [Schistosoma haematobium]|nr:unnamed protein product [Schistosoma haematobium]